MTCFHGVCILLGRDISQTNNKEEIIWKGSVLEMKQRSMLGVTEEGTFICRIQVGLSEKLTFKLNASEERASQAQGTAKTKALSWE